MSLAGAIAPTYLFRRPAGKKRLARVDEESLFERLASDQHPEAHLIAIAECRLGTKCAPTDFNVEQHDEANFGMPG